MNAELIVFAWLLALVAAITAGLVTTGVDRVVRVAERRLSRAPRGHEAPKRRPTTPRPWTPGRLLRTWLASLR
jgi:hypothetical protein